MTAMLPPLGGRPLESTVRAPGPRRVQPMATAARSFISDTCGILSSRDSFRSSRTHGRLVTCEMPFTTGPAIPSTAERTRARRPAR